MPKITKLKATQQAKTMITVVDKTDEDKPKNNKRKASTSPVKVRIESFDIKFSS